MCVYIASAQRAQLKVWRWPAHFSWQCRMECLLLWAVVSRVPLCCLLQQLLWCTVSGSPVAATTTTTTTSIHSLCGYKQQEKETGVSTTPSPSLSACQSARAHSPITGTHSRRSSYHCAFSLSLLTEHYFWCCWCWPIMITAPLMSHW